MRALVYATRDEVRESPEQPAPGLSRAEAPPEDTASHWPLVWASIHAALLTPIGQFLFTIYLALQRGVPVELRLWKRVIPTLAMNVSQAEFAELIMWSSSLTSGLLALFSISALIRPKRLQIQAGRAFAWINITLLGFLATTRAVWFDASLEPSRWMYTLMLVGAVGFAVTTSLIWIDYKDRIEAAQRPSPAEVEIEGVIS